MKFVDTKTLSHEEWLGQRQKFITASGFASIISANPFQSPYQYWEEKLAEIPIVSEDNERMEIGREIEDFIASQYMKRTGRKVREDNKIRIHPKCPHMAVNIDRLIVSENGDGSGYLECKNVDGWVYNSWESDEQGGKRVPTYYYCQVQFGLAVTGWDYGAFAILVGGNKLVIQPIKRDDKFIEEMETYAEDWWEKHINQRIPPEMESSDFKRSVNVGGEYEADEKYIVIHKLLLETKEQIGILDKRKKELESQIYSKIGENDIIVYKDQIICTWKLQGRSGLDSKRLGAEAPDIYTKYEKISHFRVLRPKKIKEVESE